MVSSRPNPCLGFDVVLDDTDAGSIVRQPLGFSLRSDTKSGPVVSPRQARLFESHARPSLRRYHQHLILSLSLSLYFFLLPRFLLAVLLFFLGCGVPLSVTS